MKRFRRRKRVKSILCFLLAILLALQGTEPIFVYAAEVVENTAREVEFERPEALTEEEAGIEKPENTEAAGEEDEAADNTQDSAQDKAETEALDEPVPDTAISNDADTVENAEPEAAEVELKEPVDYYPLPEEPEGELVAFDKESRTYKTGEKQYTTVIGGYVGTYEDEDGKMQLVDNNLEVPKTRAKARAKSGEAEASQEVYQNKENDYTVTLPENITADAGMVIEKEDYRVEIVPRTGDYSHSVVKDNAIRYNQVYDGIDVQYTVLDEDIKEDIVLQKPVEQLAYEYELKLTGLKAELKDNQVYLYPEDKTIDDTEYILEAPAMEDAAGEVSFHIALELTEEEGRTLLTVKPDQEWLASEERQYPVRIDPSTVSIGKESFSMNGVEQGSPNSYIGDNGYPYVGYDDGIKSGNLGAFGKMHRICRTYIKVNYDFSAIPKDSKIDSATFSVSQRTAYSGGTSQFGLYRVENNWSLPIKWNNQPLNHTFIDVQNASSAKNSYINYNVKDLVNDWVQGTYANNGMVLKAIDEASGLSASMQCEVLNNRASAYGPRITVQWSPAEDPYLRDMSIDDTTIVLRPMTEKNLSGKLMFDAVFADGTAKSKSTVEYYIVPDQEGEENHQTTDAKPLYTYPDSTEFNKLFPEANKYYSKDSNWQSGLYFELKQDKLYVIKAQASKADENGEMITGKEVASDSFVIYQVKQFDTFPKIAKYYGVPLANIMKDNQVQDTLVVANNTIFIRNPQTNVPYNPPALTTIDKMRIDGALMGRGLHCEFGFEPVNLNTGNFYMEQEDAVMDELGGQFSIDRSYNSKGTDQNSVFGRGWSFNYDQFLVQMEDGSILYMRGDGSYLLFDKNEDGTYSVPAGYEYELKSVSYPDTDIDYIGWEIKDADQSVWSFDKYGVLRFVTDVDGFTTKLNYDEEYNLNKIITPSGKEYGIKQNEFGYISSITLPDGGKLTYAYDENGRLVSAQDANGAECSYQYDKNNRMISWNDANGNTVVTNTYDEEGRVTKQIDANGGEASFEYNDGQTITIDNEGNRTIYKYDDMYRTTSITYPDKTGCLKSYNSENQLEKEVTAKGTKTYTYDNFGNIATETREDGYTASYSYNEQNKLTAFTDYNGNVTTYEYDSTGNMTAQNQPDGTRITFAYDDSHRIVARTDGRGITTSFSYDGANLVSYVDGEGHTWSLAYDAMNRIISQTDPLGNVESISYNANGDIISETAGDSGTVKYGLDKVGNITSITDASGNVTEFSYDAMYNLTKGTDAKGHAISYKYNKNYQVVLATDAKENTTSYKYDSMGRVIAESNEDFGTRLYEYDKAGNQTKYTDGEGNSTISEYNFLGLPTKITDGTGNATQYSYDALGNETAVLYADGGSCQTTYDSMGRIATETDELGMVLTYQYDANGNVTAVSDADGRVYTYEYDGNDNRVRMTNPEGGSASYVYDEAGRMVSYTNEEGQTETYTYDGAGRITGIKNALEETSSFEYDKNGNVVKSIDENGNVSTYTYDKVGNLASVTDPIGNITALKYDKLDNLHEVIDALKGSTKYSYNSQGNYKKVTDALGNEYIYTYDKNGNNVSLAGPEETGVTKKYDAAGQLIYAKDAHGLELNYQYDSVGRLIKEEDNAGNSKTYTYNKAGNLISQTDQLDRVYNYTYDQHGRLIEIKEPDGSVTTYEYDVMNRITAVTDAEGIRTQFVYDKVGNQLSMTKADEAVYQYAYDQLNRVTSITNPLGAVKSYRYDGNGNVLEAVDENGTTTKYTYDANDNLIKQVNGNGSTTAYEYDELNRMIKETSPMKEVSEYRYDAVGNLTKYKDPMELITEYKYDGLGNMTSSISPKGAVTAYTYDKHSNVTSVTDPKGNKTSYTVDLGDNVTKLTQPNGGEYTYTYDKAGRIKTVTSPLGYKKNFTYDVADNVTRETDSLKNTVTYTYDRLHRLLSSTNPLDGTSNYEYDKYGNLVKETDSLGRANTYTYDLVGQMVQAADPLGKITALTYDPVGNITSITKPGGRTTQYTYDKNYNVTGITDPMGYVSQTVYDKDDRLTEEIDALKQKVSYTYDKDGRVTAITDKRGYTTGYEYDPHSNIITVADRTGLKIHYEYDLNDNLTKVTDPMGWVTNYGYDSMDNLISYTNAVGKHTEYSYDLEGNLTSIEDPAGRTESFGYDEKGRLTSHTFASGKKTSYDYDKLNDLLEKSYENAKGEKTDESVTYAYNGAGERVSMQDQTGKSTYEYDALGRISKVTNGSGKEITYVYSEADNLQEIVYPDGTKVSYEYDLNDNLIKVTDRNGKGTEYRHDALGRVTETIRSNGTKTAVDYDAENHITKLVNTCGVCGEVISSYEYTYNEQGYVVGEKSSELEAGTRKAPSWDDWYNWGGTKQESCGEHKHNEKAIKTSRTYEYDDNWELTRCTEKVEGGTRTVHNYTYDKIGNRAMYERLEDGITKVKYKYQYNDSNQLVKKTNAKVWGDKGIVYRYDEDGNLTSRCDKNSSSRPVTYEYTAENRLAVVEKGGTVLMAAMYDGDNNRVFQIDNTRNWEDQYGDAVLIPESQRTENGDSPKEELASVIEKGADAKGYVLTEYINDINRQNTQVLAEYGADNTLQKAYTYGDNRISVDKAEENSYYLYDGRASVTGLLTEAGTLANSYTYDSYGNLSSGTPDAVNYYGYNAESTDTNTGFQYLRARYYNPETGTFTTEDSDLGTKENPLTRNRYAYAGNNPLNYSDPTGHRAASPAAAATVAKRGISRTVRNLIKVRQSVSSRNAERPPVRTFKLSRAYQNAQKAKTNAGKTKNSTSWISNLTKRLRDAHIKEFCTSNKEKVKTDWKKIGNIVLVGMTAPFMVNMHILGKGLREVGEFLSSPMTRVFASSALEALGAVMLINGLASALPAAAAGATGAGAPAVALDGAIIAAGAAMLFVGESGRRQAVDDLKEEASHSEEDSDSYKKYDVKEIEKRYGLKKGEFHREVKPDILSDLTSKDSPYRDLMKKMGNNPDIYLSTDGQIEIVSTQFKGKSFVTDLNIADFLP